MKERGEKKEVESDFWEGHSFTDGCELGEKPDFIDLIHEGFSEMSRDSEDIESLEELRELFRTGEMTTMKRFGKKEIFDPKDFPLGTIVRLSRDYQDNSSFLIWHSQRESHDLYGITSEQIIRGERHDVLVCFKTQQLQEQEGSSPHLPNRVFFGAIKVGTVDHYVKTEPAGVFDNFRKTKAGSNLQSLERVNYVEVVEYGTRLRVRQPDALTRRNGLRLNPAESI